MLLVLYIFCQPSCFSAVHLGVSSLQILFHITPHAPYTTYTIHMTYTLYTTYTIHTPHNIQTTYTQITDHLISNFIPSRDEFKSHCGSQTTANACLSHPRICAVPNYKVFLSQTTDNVCLSHPRICADPNYKVLLSQTADNVCLSHPRICAVPNYN